MDPVYLDYNATAPIRPEALEAYLGVCSDPANASSVYQHGRRARKIVEVARASVAALAGVAPEQVVFNSGATEANNTVFSQLRKEHIAVSADSHPSVTDALEKPVLLPVGRDGRIDTQAFADQIMQTPPPVMISIPWVNNETGVIHPVEDLARSARRRGVSVHIDAAQAPGRIPSEYLSSVMQSGLIDFLTLSGHKIGGPMGTGALILGSCTSPPVMLYGGGQEKGARSGTENVPAIAGFGAAARALMAAEPEEAERLQVLRDRMEQALIKRSPELVFIGKGVPRAPNTSFFALPGIPSQTLLMALDLDGISVSNGSACSSGTVKSSRVLKAAGYDETIAGSALRISTGWHTAPDDIDRFLESWEKLYTRIRHKIIPTEDL